MLLGLLGTFALAVRWEVIKEKYFLPLWLTASVGLAVFSVTTGIFNNLTDEPYATPAFIQLWPNLYHGVVHSMYFQFGRPPPTKTWSFIYLPLLPFYQIPDFSYRYLMVLTWGGTAFLLRKNLYSLMLFTSPTVGLLAASGFSDFVPFLFITLSFVTLQGYQSRLAEVVSLGLKQLANVLIIGYHLLTRQWWRAAEAVLITVAICLPFILLDPSGFWNNAIIGNCSAGCLLNGQSIFGWNRILSHDNYSLWPVFAIAVFGPKYGIQHFKRLLNRVIHLKP
jgi:hypothetical protein